MTIFSCRAYQWNLCIWFCVIANSTHYYLLYDFNGHSFPSPQCWWWCWADVPLLHYVFDINYNVFTVYIAFLCFITHIPGESHPPCQPANYDQLYWLLIANWSSICRIQGKYEIELQCPILPGCLFVLVGMKNTIILHISSRVTERVYNNSKRPFPGSALLCFNSCVCTNPFPVCILHCSHNNVKYNKIWGI